jgi:hypothetical protein
MDDIIQIRQWTVLFAVECMDCMDCMDAALLRFFVEGHYSLLLFFVAFSVEMCGIAGGGAVAVWYDGRANLPPDDLQRTYERQANQAASLREPAEAGHGYGYGSTTESRGFGTEASSMNSFSDSPSTGSPAQGVSDDIAVYTADNQLNDSSTNANFRSSEGEQIASSPITAIDPQNDALLNSNVEHGGAHALPFQSFASPSPDDQYVPSPQFSASSSRARELLDRMGALTSLDDGEELASSSIPAMDTQDDALLNSTAEHGDEHVSPSFASPVNVERGDDDGDGSNGYVPSPQFSASSNRAKALLDRMNALNSNTDLDRDKNEDDDTDSTINI